MRISSITKNAGKACNNRLYRHIRTFKKIVKNYFVISSKKVKEIYFTGMFTANQGDLFVQYYDPESKRIRQYYPDFLAKMDDGSYQLIEVKGDNMIDDEVVKAKAEAAEEMSVASGMKYVMYAGSVLMKQNVLEHPPVTYSDEPSPLLMVAEDPVPYGK